MQIKRRAKKKHNLITSGIILILVVFSPQLWNQFRYNDQIYETLDIPKNEYGIIFGAHVAENKELADVTRERTDAGILLYRHGRIEKLFISGDNRHNQEAEVIAEYAEESGVKAEDIIVDHLGIDTEDTCRHFAEIASSGVLLTQGFHLPRAMYLCEKNQIEVIGVSVNKLELLESRGSNFFTILWVRANRYVKESVLTWAYLLGVYSKFSNEAEMHENGY